MQVLVKGKDVRHEKINRCPLNLCAPTINTTTVGNIITGKQADNDPSYLVLHPRDIDEPSPSYCQQRPPLCCQLQQMANDPMKTVVVIIK